MKQRLQSRGCTANSGDGSDVEDRWSLDEDTPTGATRAEDVKDLGMGLKNKNAFKKKGKSLISLEI